MVNLSNERPKNDHTRVFIYSNVVILFTLNNKVEKYIIYLVCLDRTNPSISLYCHIHKMIHK